MRNSVRNSVLLALLAGLCPLLGCGESHDPSRDMKAHPATLATDVPPPLKLTLASSGRTVDVPPPAQVTPEMRRTKQYAQWWSIGDIRRLEWTDAQGRRTVAQMIGRAQEVDGTIRPMIPAVSRYRPDGTLEVTTLNAPTRGPDQWTVFAADGKTKSAEVHCRDAGGDGKPEVERVTFYDAAGARICEYALNRDGGYSEKRFGPSQDSDRPQ